jgi:hypothetical protein
MPASASNVMNAFGSGMKASGEQGAGAYQAQVARNNQTIANDNADLATFKGTQAVGISREKTAQMVGMDRAGSGANGVDVNSGSALRTQMDTARIGAMDAQTIQANAARSAWGYKVQAQDFGQEAVLDRAKGNQAAIASLIGGGANFADKWNKFRNTGAVPADET